MYQVLIGNHFKPFNINTNHSTKSDIFMNFSTYFCIFLSTMLLFCGFRKINKTSVNCFNSLNTVSKVLLWQHEVIAIVPSFYKKKQYILNQAVSQKVNKVPRIWLSGLIKSCLRYHIIKTHFQRQSLPNLEQYLFEKMSVVEALIFSVPMFRFHSLSHTCFVHV